MAAMINLLRTAVRAVGTLLLIAALTACLAYRDDYNPIKILCPGDFDPVANKCVIPTGGID